MMTVLLSRRATPSAVRVRVQGIEDDKSNVTRSGRGICHFVSNDTFVAMLDCRYRAESILRRSTVCTSPRSVWTGAPVALPTRACDAVDSFGSVVSG
eukprot:2271072-Rhodomonas_salina.3